METPKSNLPIRRKAIRGAIFWTLIPMLLAGLGSGLFPVARYLDHFAAQETCAASMDTLARVEEDLVRLTALLDSAAATTGQLLELDEQWEAKPLAAARAELQLQMDRLEKQLGELTTASAAISTLNPRIGVQLHLLLTTRAQLQEWRRMAPPPPPPDPNTGGGTVDECRENLRAARDKARDIATRIQTHSDEVQKDADSIKRLLGKNNRTVQENIQNSVDHLKELVRELRQL